MEECKTEDLCLIPRIGCLSMDFALLLWSAYADYLRVEGARRAITYTWMAQVMGILRRDPRAKREDYNWVLAAVPTEKSLSEILRRTYSLVSNQVHDLKIAVAVLDGHVVRADGHFKAPLRVLRKSGESGPGCLLAFLGCGGFLLDEVKIYTSESGDAYLEGARPILERRHLAGMRPPHFIVDNPPLLEGRIQNLVRSIWKEEPEFVLAGDPTHRLIEFREKIDKTHQDSVDVSHDFSYALMRFGHLLQYGAQSESANAFGKLRRETDRLFELMRNTRTDPYSASHPKNINAWGENPSRECYYRTFERLSKTRELRRRREIPKTHASILHTYFATGRLRGELPDGIRNSLLDYWESPFLLNGYFLPCGAVRRVLRASDKIRHADTGAKIPIEADVFPTYLSYSEYERELIRIVNWYASPVRTMGAFKGHHPKREDEERNRHSGSPRYAVKKSSVLTKEAINVIRKGALRENCVYYFRHAQVANAMRDAAFVEKFDPDIQLGTSSSSNADHSDFDTPNAEPSRPRNYEEYPPLSSTNTFKTGTANVEAFFHELLREMPQGHSRSGIKPVTFQVWSTAFFARRAVSSYARYAPRKCARSHKMEFSISL